MTSGRAACTCEWMANAAWFTGALPSTTSPVWLTRMRSDTRICLKDRPNGLTQKWSSSSGSRAVMWPAAPSSKPNFPNSRNAPARRCLRKRRSSSIVRSPVAEGNFTSVAAMPASLGSPPAGRGQERPLLAPRADARADELAVELQVGEQPGRVGVEVQECLRAPVEGARRTLGQPVDRPQLREQCRERFEVVGPG